ncbi:tRNA glutamyl-Q(34) synthetase GluQRS [Psychrosphaera sp. I2R16]|uniref:tRNA glutamyl-Q(34) synthetase GluQRS n=1 Tax=unclassified Psychrosphaera TaxID=2641570 RepID=UPI0034CD4433
MSHTFTNLFSNQSTLLKQAQYRGRFAPSPSGPLHFGSLLTALGSYLQAKANHGLWFVRIEDIDKPREQFGAVDQILDALSAFGMSWDIDPNTSEDLAPADRGCLVQTRRLRRYQEILDTLHAHNLTYACHCSRKKIRQMGTNYTGYCRNKNLPLTDAAIRICNDHVNATKTNSDFDHEDYIIKRRDGLFAYQLVVVIDDIDQGITEVVRGADILPLTTRQTSLYKLFGITPPNYMHLPLVSTKPGFKLSKQNHARAIDINNPKPELIQALTLLGLPVQQDLMLKSVADIITWAVAHWDIANLPDTTEIIISEQKTSFSSL